MSTESEPKLCPKCQATLPEDAPQGLCPKCLLSAAATPTEAGQSLSESPAPPALETIAAAFPHLEILELIGQGGMGFVFKARQPKLDRFVALKILPQSLAADPAFAVRFEREGRVLARLNHPNIVTIHDFGQANGFFFLLMEFVDGVNLRQAMRIGRFTPAQALAVVPKICEALQFAHNEGILHRDIKPENILLDSKGRVKIADFGIAKLMETGGNWSADLRSGADLPEKLSAPGRRPALHSLTETGKVLGTLQYMAPEQLERPGEVDHRADIYSLGVVFYEMLTGELPIGRFAPPSEKSDADRRVDDVVLRTLEKERERRPQSADEVKTRVETIAGTPQTSAAAADERALADTRSQVRGPATALLVVGVLNLILQTLGLFFWGLLNLGHGSAYRGLVMLAACGLAMCVSGFIIYAALKMLSLRRHAAAQVASVLAMFFAPACVIGLPVGIWALIVLNRREIRAAFETNRTRSPHAAAGSGSFTTPGLIGAGIAASLAIVAGLIVVFLFVSLLWYRGVRARHAAEASFQEMTAVPAEPEGPAVLPVIPESPLPQASENIPGLPATEAQRQDLAARLTATKSISDWMEKGHALAGIAKDAARVGEANLARQALSGIADWVERDTASHEAVLALSSRGLHTEAAGIASSMSDFQRRDTSFAQIAKDAAEAGDATAARQAVGKMSQWEQRDAAAHAAALALKALGRRAEAIGIANSMSSPQERDKTLRELSR